MVKIASELLVERLADWGVDTVFGLPGDGINGIMEGLRRHRDRVRFLLVHHEEAAAFMATGYAKSTGRLGVCLATSGPGGIHLLNGLYDARLDHVPVLAITGMQATSLLGTGFQQEVHLERLFDDVAEYNVLVHVPVQIPTLVDNAVRTALARHTVSHITIPVDVQESDADLKPYEGGLGLGRTPETAPIYLQSPVVPAQTDLLRAAEVLNAEAKVAMLVGAGALGARDEVLAAAELLGSPIVKTLPGKAVVPDSHPLVTGGLGLLGTRPSEQAVEECNGLFMVGTNFPYTAYLPEKARVVQIEADPTRAGARIATEVPLVGDAAHTLRALTPLLHHKAGRSFLAEAQQRMREWRKDMAALENPEREPIRPQYLMRVIDRLAADDAILSTDSGTVATWAARHFDIRGDRQFMLSGNLATMAPSVPYTIAAQWAHPGQQCLAFVGDGGFAMLMAEFLTAMRYQLPIKVFVCNNGLLAQILWEQMVLGYPEYGVRFQGPPPFAPWAEACGGFGIRIEEPGDLEDAVANALAWPGPALVDVVVNPDEPPLPAKVRYNQAKGFAEAFLKGQPRRTAIAATLFRDKYDQFKA
ncbi:thiamine pyrophosphate-binding protein [Pseudonocardia sp. H11422]|uniref:thiamine pyrophosphate-binding protein n=1 Tax=Pseudonocardia sp. H11422 TaxID=2835866 RepID=UPI001BDCBC99|nr:thiamine pyrophosphate-binding protein [Pseudonocardia sp. H11422]